MSRALVLVLALSCGAPETEMAGELATCCGTAEVQAQAQCMNGRAVICAPLDSAQGPAPLCYDAHGGEWRQGQWIDVGSCSQ